MGWLFFEKPEKVKKWFEEQLTWDDPKTGRKFRCLDSAIVNVSTAYGAMEITGPNVERRVVGIVFLLKFVPKDPRFSFGYKDMDEDCGPVESKCPEKILNLLTPTDNESALRWRQRCRDYIEERKRVAKMVKPGKVLVPLEGDEIEINGYGKFNRFEVARHPFKKRVFFLNAIRQGGHFPVQFKLARWFLSKLKEAEA